MARWRLAREPLGETLLDQLVNPRAFEPDLNGLPSVNVADYPTRFKHYPRIGLRAVVQAALGDLHAVNEDKNVTVFIPLNLANRFLMVHGYRTA